jgi:mycothiol synthase
MGIEANLTMELRELAEADLPAVLELCRRTLPLDAFELPVLRRRLLGEPGRKPAYQLCLWDGPRLAAIAMGGVRNLPDRPGLLHRGGLEGTLQLFAVDPDYRRRGLASQLIASLEDRMRADHLGWLRVGNVGPSYLWPGVDVRYTAALCVLMSRGFRQRGDAVNMLVDLGSRAWDTTAEEQRLSAAGYTVRRLDRADRQQFHDWLQAVWGPIWSWEAMSTLENDPISTFVARKDGHFGSFASYNATSFPNSFGPTGTADQERRSGLGRVLFYRCMRDLRERGYAQAEVCWVGPVAYYARIADATISRVFYWFEKEL